MMVIRDDPTLQKVEWPNLFNECEYMLVQSILCYGFSDLRKLIKERKITNPDVVEVCTNFPIPFGRCFQVMNKFKEEIEAATGKDHCLYQTAMDASFQRFSEEVEKSAELNERIQILSFDDSTEASGLVYGIVVNRAHQRITITFRGTVSMEDVKTDLKSGDVEIPDPTDREKYVHIHRGFRDYMYGSTPFSLKHVLLSRGQSQSKAEQPQERRIDGIIENVLRALDQFPGFSLYVSGHSLGASLATILALELAASEDQRITKPVSCVQFASPKVGTISFALAFRKMEKEGKVRCLRVSNKKDVVVDLPSAATLNPLFVTFCPKNIYRHVGINIKLDSKPGEYKIWYPRNYKHPFRLWWDDSRAHVQRLAALIRGTLLIAFEDFPKEHSCNEYWNRIHAAQAQLERLKLNDLYAAQGNRKAQNDVFTQVFVKNMMVMKNIHGYY